MDIIQTFYDRLATQYDQLFLDWEATTREQASFLHDLFVAHGFSLSSQVLDCACGIGTQAIGLAALGYDVTASDISRKELQEAERRARGLRISFSCADFRRLSEVFTQRFDLIICMDNALPHMLTHEDLDCAVKSILDRLADGGLFVASIRDYDALLLDKPPYSPPYIHKTSGGQRVSFQTWNWEGEVYRLTQYIIQDEDTLQISKFDCMYRATRRDVLTRLLLAHGCREVKWLMPEDCGFYQPVVVGRK